MISQQKLLDQRLTGAAFFKKTSAGSVSHFDINLIQNFELTKGFMQVNTLTDLKETQKSLLLSETQRTYKLT